MMGSYLLRGTMLAAALIASPVGAQSQPSAELQAALASLSIEQQAFIEDEENLAPFGMSQEKLYILLEGRDANTVSATIAAMMDTLDSARYQPEGEAVDERGPSDLDPAGDMAFVPLNTLAGRFNGSTVLQPPIFDENVREPGPVSLHRYMYETDGIPTFGNLPVAVRVEDLTAGGVEAAFVGVPMSLSSGWRDAQNAPDLLRTMKGIGGYDIEAGLDPLVELTVVDYGDLSVNRMAAELSVEHVRMMIGDMVGAGVVPMIVGGDHAVMYPTVAAMADRFGAGNVAVVHLDAHANVEQELPHTISDEQSVYRLIEDGLLEGGNLTQIGIRGTVSGGETINWLRDQGAHLHPMSEISRDGWDTVSESAMRTLGRGPEKVFVSFDMSVLDPAFASGAGRPVSGGLTMREILPMIREICTTKEVVGFEILDVAPFLDLSYATALNANQIMNECLIGMALRKKGG